MCDYNATDTGLLKTTWFNLTIRVKYYTDVEMFRTDNLKVAENRTHIASANIFSLPHTSVKCFISCFFNPTSFYRASACYICRARYCVSKSVRLSVCPSHFDIVSKRIVKLFLPPNRSMTIFVSKRTPLVGALKTQRMEKFCDFQP